MKSLTASFRIPLFVFLILMGIVVSAFALEEVLPRPKVKVTVSPAIPSSYMNTWINVDAADPFGISHIFIRTGSGPNMRGLDIYLNWGDETPGPWKATYRLPELFGHDALLQGTNQLQIVITVLSTIGKKTTVIKRIEFKREE